ncbi:hypothetical protein COU76_05585 [Candidatus Peregrinibacteria bacterium CG10_big_fil_rev_8_21_14_0_10_49_10]|nr:MAG: hypothetical protein COU76_05585 [Candidatus Peregrinibacteria bacterium CG10_big_fil_rev_8_21_14_0_10_49_10]
MTAAFIAARTGTVICIKATAHLQLATVGAERALKAGTIGSCIAGGSIGHSVIILIPWIFTATSSACVTAPATTTIRCIT